MIPVKNIYYLLCYAWNRLDEAELVNVDATESTELVDLFARILIQVTNQIFKRGLDRAYINVEEDLQGVQGKINIDASLKRLLFRAGRANCQFDELTHDSLLNQILRTTIGHLMRVDNVHKDHKKHLRQLHDQLFDVTEIRIDSNTFRRVQINRNNAAYRLALNVCELIYSALLPEQRAGHYKFRDFFRDEVKMRALFQDFIYHFYRIELRDTHDVKVDRIKWHTIALDSSATKLLPEMRTDVSIRSPEQTTIIDTKYSSNSLQSYMGKSTFRSEHLFQIYAYLKNLESRGFPDSRARGILLYPENGVSLRSDFEVPGHLITVFALDLSKEWQDIKNDLFALLSTSHSFIDTTKIPV